MAVYQPSMTLGVGSGEAITTRGIRNGLLRVMSSDVEKFRGKVHGKAAKRLITSWISFLTCDERKCENMPAVLHLECCLG